MKNDFKVYVANLSAYNSGELKGEWFTLPVDMEEVYDAIFDEDELDEQGNPHGDWAIHDYDFPIPFKVKEFDSIEDWGIVIRFLKENLDDRTISAIANKTYNARDLQKLAVTLKQSYHVEHFVTKEQIIDDLKVELDQGNIYSVKNKLKNVNIDSIQRNELIIQDGYGNYRSIFYDDLESILDSILESFIDEEF